MVQWLLLHASVLAVLITAGVAIFLVCCLECSSCPAREKDDLFHRNEI